MGEVPSMAAVSWMLNEFKFHFFLFDISDYMCCEHYEHEHMHKSSCSCDINHFISCVICQYHVN